MTIQQPPLGADSEKQNAREHLYGRMLSLLIELDDDATEQQINTYLDTMLRADPALAQAATKAGGRWQVSGGQLVFTAW